MPAAGNSMVRMSGITGHAPIITSVVRWAMNNIHVMVKLTLFIHWKETV
jgi:hypothetical protein